MLPRGVTSSGQSHWEKFSFGTVVRVRERAFLEEFRKEWKFHRPLEDRIPMPADISYLDSVVRRRTDTERSGRE